MGLILYGAVVSVTRIISTYEINIKAITVKQPCFRDSSSYAYFSSCFENASNRLRKV
jgi:hypothetical protein